MRVGQGYDSHRMRQGSGLSLGGLKIACDYEFIAHSDGDVLIHAIIDALLGAARLGDIGRHFPDTSEEFRGADSKVLLSKTKRLLDKAGYEIINIDSTVIIERPKLKGYIAEMEEGLEGLLGLDKGSVSVKAKTDEGLGAVGKNEAAKAYAIALIKKKA